MCSSDVFLSLLAILFPPLPVWVKRGICSADSVVNCLLFILGYIPGLIHAWYIIFTYPEPPYDYDYQQGAHNAEHGRIYVFVADGSAAAGVRGPGPHQGAARSPLQQNPSYYAAQPKIQANMNYGATAHSNNNNNNPSHPAGSNSSNYNHHYQQQPQHAGQEEGVAGPSDAPPSYAQVVASGAPGDHKIQTQD